jgi:tetratricopeptide (TPR) repeat protein
LRQKRDDEAVVAFKAAISKERAGGSSWTGYAQALQRTGATASEVRNAAEKAVQVDPASEIARIILAKHYLAQDDFSAAEKSFKTALDLDPDSARGWYEYGLFLLKQPDRAREAEVAMGKAVESKDGYPCVVPKELAGILIHRGAEEDAIRVLEKAIQLNPNCYCSHTLLGGIASRKHEFAESRACFERALEANPQGVSALAGLAQVAIDHSRDFDAAEALILRAMKANAEDSRVLVSRAALKHSRGLQQGALEDCHRALQLDPEAFEARLFLGLVQARTGAVESAIESLRTSLSAIKNRRELIPAVVDLAVELAAKGQAIAVAQAIELSDEERLLEPLAVALSIVLGDRPLVAQEIVEVAKDIVARIGAPLTQTEGTFDEGHNLAATDKGT